MADQPNALPDVDPQETKEWIDALEGVIAQEGAERAHYLIDKLIGQAREDGIVIEREYRQQQLCHEHHGHEQ